MNYLDYIRSKIYNIATLNQMLAVWRFRQNKIVFTNGCFDILHLGHIDYLAKARNLGDILVVGLNTDDSVSRIKGTGRPVNNEIARSLTLASLTFVDAIVMFDEDTPLKLINIVNPDILVKGSDYKPDEIVGADIVKKKSGKIITLDFLEGYSTTSLISKLKNTE